MSMANPLTELSNKQQWLSYLTNPRMSTLSNGLQALYQDPEHLRNELARIGPGDASSEALAGLYSALCLCQELDDDKAVAMLEMVDDQIHANPLQALAPSHRALDTTPAVLALERPAWLKVLQQRGLKPGARYSPAGGPMRRLTNTTLLHAACHSVCIAGSAKQRGALERSVTQLLIAGADPAALDCCGMTPIDWLLRDELLGQAPKGSVKALSPAVARQLWIRSSGHLSRQELQQELQELLPLLQMPLPKLTKTVLKVARKRLPLLETHALSLRVSTWEEVVQLLPLTVHWLAAPYLLVMLQAVLANCSIMQGRPIPLDASMVQRHDKTTLPAALRPVLLAHYKAHPQHVALYTALPPAGITNIIDKEALALLPGGLRAALALARSNPRIDSHELQLLLNSTCSVLNEGSCCAVDKSAWVQQAEDRKAAQQHVSDMLARWLEQGLAGELREASSLGCASAVDFLVSMGTRSRKAMQNVDGRVLAAYVDCVVGHGGVHTYTQELCADLAQMADMLQRPGPLPEVKSSAVYTMNECVGVMAATEHRRAELLAGAVGQQLRRLARHLGDARLDVDPAEAKSAPGMLLRALVRDAAVLVGVLDAGEADVVRVQEGLSMLEVMLTGGKLEEWEASAARERASLQRAKVKEYGRSCDGCGRLAAEVQEEGGRLQCCTGCSAAWYCSRSCQKEAWKGHRKACLAAQAVAAGAAASSSASAGDAAAASASAARGGGGGVGKAKQSM